MTARSFTFAVTCGACGADVEVTGTKASRQTRRANVTCTACGQAWVVTVSMTKPSTADRAHAHGGPRLPWPPLARFLPAGQADVADHLGLNYRTVARYRNDGIPADLADQLADAVGVHPARIWGGAYYLATGTGRTEAA